MTIDIIIRASDFFRIIFLHITPSRECIVALGEGQNARNVIIKPCLK